MILFDTDLLKRLAQLAPHSVGTTQARLEEVLEYMMCAPPSTTSAMVQAIQPVLAISTPLLDACIFKLRKALFSRYCLA